jgi:hypothetical protein
MKAPLIPAALPHNTIFSAGHNKYRNRLQPPRRAVNVVKVIFRPVNGRAVVRHSRQQFSPCGHSSRRKVPFRRSDSNRCDVLITPVPFVDGGCGFHFRQRMPLFRRPERASLRQHSKPPGYRRVCPSRLRIPSVPVFRGRASTDDFVAQRRSDADRGKWPGVGGICFVSTARSSGMDSPRGGKPIRLGSHTGHSGSQAYRTSSGSGGTRRKRYDNSSD